MISLDLFGDPIPQKRARTFNNHGKIVTWDSQSKIKEGYKWQIRSQYNEEPLNEPLAIDILFRMPIPNSATKRIKQAMLNGAHRHIKRPDLDNLCKLVLDVLNGLVYRDDSQIDQISMKKIYSTNPGTFIRIIPIEQQVSIPIPKTKDIRYFQ